MDEDDGPGEELTPDAHVEWVGDEVATLLTVTDAQLDEPTPSCPGWSVGTVLGHLARGAGMAHRRRSTSSRSAVGR